MRKAAAILLVVLLALAAGARNNGTRRLPPGATTLGVTRSPVVSVRPGENHASPALAVTPAGEVFVAAVSLEDDKHERIHLRRAEAPDKPLGPPTAVSHGVRAWRPRLAAAANGAVWLAWCGLEQAAERGTHARSVFLRRIAPGEPGPQVTVSEGPYSCEPDLAVAPDGVLHLAWESWAPERPAEIRIQHRAFSPTGTALGPPQPATEGPFDRRPSLAWADAKLHLAWDRLVDTSPAGSGEPDYDVLVRTLRGNTWGAAVTVDGREGIQAAPDLAPARSGGVLVAYHTGHRFPPVKWWALRRVRGTRVQALAGARPAAEQTPSGEQQGAEFPALAARPAGGLVVLSRPSQGAYLHIAAGGRRVLPPLDLTRRQWGCRGMRADTAFAPDGSLLAVRRARHEVVLERFTFKPGSFRGPPAFTAVSDPAKPKRAAVRREPPAADGILGPEFPKQKVYFGDVHMHSAVSDGTGPADEIYARAFVRGMDFAVLTDHDAIIGSRMFPSEYDANAWVTDLFDARTGFATLHAFEWTTRSVSAGGFGHRNVYFRDEAPPTLYGLKDGYNTTQKLFAALKEERAFAVPHHTAWTGTDWNAADPAIQRHVEIVSVHGAFEHKGNQPIASRGELDGMFVVDGLRRGLRFGFLGGTDSHGLRFHHGIGRKADPWDHALTGVVAHGGTRTQLWDAMHDRHTFATSGVRMRVALSVGLVAMGGEVELESPVQVRYAVHGTAPLTEVLILRNGSPAHRVEVAGEECEGGWEDSPREGSHAYYLRAVQSRDIGDVDVAWSSPVFITIK